MLVVYSVLIGYILRLPSSQMWMIWLFLSANLCHTGRVTESPEPPQKQFGHVIKVLGSTSTCHYALCRFKFRESCNDESMQGWKHGVNICEDKFIWLQHQSILWCDVTVLVHHLGTRFNQIHGVPAARQWNVASLRQNVANSSDVAASSEAGSPWFLGWPCVSQGYETSDVLYAHNHS